MKPLTNLQRFLIGCLLGACIGGLWLTNLPGITD